MELDYKNLIWDSDKKDYFDPVSGKHVQDIIEESVERRGEDVWSENSEVVDEIIESVRNGEWL